MCDRRETCHPPAPHFSPIPLVSLCDADTERLRSVFEEGRQRPVWPVRVNRSVQELGSSSASIGWDSSRVLWKRLFHLAVDGLINNSAEHCGESLWANDNNDPLTCRSFSCINFACITIVKSENTMSSSEQNLTKPSV